MSTCDNSYYRLLFAIRERNKYDSVFESALDELSGKVDFSWVKSCVSIGTGHGTHEILFAQHFLPNLKTFVAVENDHESVKAFKANIQVEFIASLFLGVSTRVWANFSWGSEPSLPEKYFDSARKTAYL